MVGDLCQQRIPVDHTVVLRLGRIRWRGFSDPGNLHTMGGALRASSYDRRGAILGRPQGLLFYRRRLRIARGVVCNARGADTARRRTLCSGFIHDRSNNRLENKPVGRISCTKMIALTWRITCPLECCERSRWRWLLSASPTALLPSTADDRARQCQFRDQLPGRNPQTRSRHPHVRQAGNKPIVFRRRRRPNRSAISPGKPPSSRGRFSTTRMPRPSGTLCVQLRA
jgi:hypothetical protein